jgi:hypothetical protein
MRYQEFYESSNERFVNNSFTIAEFVLWYSNNVGKGEFTYCTDWAGFNFPLDIIKKCHDCGISDPNMYDSFMWGIYKMIDTLEPDSYLIGTSKESDTIIDHELTHAMYYINEKYKTSVDDVIKYAIAWWKPFYEKICEVLSNEGYAPHVFWDEINAYLTEEDVFDPIQDLENEMGYKKLRENLITLRKDFFEGDKSKL